MTNNQHKRDFLQAVAETLQDGSFARLTLTDYVGNEEDLKKITVKKLEIKREEKLGFNYTYKTRDIAKNYSHEEGISRISEFLRDGFQQGMLCTTKFDLVLDSKKLRQNPPSIKEAPSLSHDRSKNRLIESHGKSYLHDLKITDAKGEVFKNAQDKFRQINKYVEILGVHIKDMPEEKLAKIADMGSGKGYLTFALYDYITNVLNKKTHVTGVEYRKDMVDLCNGISQKSGFGGLDFVQGTIEEYDAKECNILIALHACDTATDDAIAKGISAGSELIVVAPCCHKQIRREMEQNKKNNDVDFLVRHGIFMERQAEMVTDGIRALILEYFGYSVKVFEFISDAHTPKNVLIIGSKNSKAKERDPKILEKIKNSKEYFGIGQHHLERMTGI